VDSAQAVRDYRRGQENYGNCASLLSTLRNGAAAEGGSGSQPNNILIRSGRRFDKSAAEKVTESAAE
jgi:hypothetical protein